MTARERDDPFDSREAAIIAESRIAAAIERFIRRCAASAHGARSWRLVQRVARELGVLPPPDRGVIVLVTVAVALVGHGVLGWMRQSPRGRTRGLRAVALVAAGLPAVP